MKRIFLVIFLVCCINYQQSFASEEVYLDISESRFLKVPEQKCPVNLSSDEIEEVDLYMDEEVFDSKTGRAFTKFVNDVVIDNKLNQKTNKMIDKY